MKTASVNSSQHIFWVSQSARCITLKKIPGYREVVAKSSVELGPVIIFPFFHGWHYT